MNTMISAVVPTRKYMQELVDRLETITRFMESQDYAWGREEAMSIVDAMIKRASQLRDSLGPRERDMSLDELRGRLSAMALCAIIADYDKAIGDLQNAVGDQVQNHERATETPDSRGRDVLDFLEVSHLRLRNVMRTIAGAAAV